MSFCSNQSPLTALLFGIGRNTQEFEGGKAILHSGLRSNYKDPLNAGIPYPIEIEMVSGNICGIAKLQLTTEDAISLADHIYESYKLNIPTK